MKFNLNLITLALITSAGTTLSDDVQAATGYSLSNAKTETVKFDKWVCKRCKPTVGYQGQIGVGAGYHDSDDLHSSNAFATEDEFVGKLDVNVRYKSETGYQASLKTENLGMENGRLSAEAGKAGQYKLAVNLRQFASYQSQTVQTPYQGVGHDQLNAPIGWQTAGSSSQMPMLEQSLQPFELSLKRRREGIRFDYQAPSSWSGYIGYQHEQKTGIKTASGSFYNQSIMLPEPVDTSTDQLNAGLNLHGQNWFANLSYTGSKFDNDHNQLGYDNLFNPTFGAQTTGYMALDPDNESHQFALQARYMLDNTVFSGRLHYANMTQDQDFVQMGYLYPMPVPSLDGQVDVSGLTLKATTRMSRALQVNVSYDYYSRDDDTQVEAWTQYTVSDANGEIYYNLPYDHDKHLAKISANYRLARGMKLEAGLDYRKDERNYQDRETTDEQTLWAKYSLTNIPMWNFYLKADYGQRDGSKYQASQWTSSQSNDLLRKYHLADRKRSQIEARVSHTPTDALTLDFAARFALDDYNKTQIGLTESEDIGVDFSLSYQVSDDLYWSGFYSNQVIESTQAGSTNFGAPNWSSQVEDQVDVVGVGMDYQNLMDNKLALGIDYSYSNSDSNTQVTQGLTGDYGDYYAKVHNINLYAKYQVDSQMSWRFDYQVENYKDNDAANSIAADDIWNVVSFGSLNHDYTAHLVMISLQYKL